jgi:hypothetical protein
MPTIKIFRPSNFWGGLRKFKVYLNDKQIGNISNGETKEFQIPSGQHKIYCKQDLFNSLFIYDFSIEESQTKTFTVQYLKKPMFLTFFVLGFFISGLLSQWLTALLKINQQFWLAFYVFFGFIFLLLMKATKHFAINISE